MAQRGRRRWNRTGERTYGHYQRCALRLFLRGPGYRLRRLCRILKGLRQPLKLMAKHFGREIEPALAGLLPRLAYRYTQPQTGQLGLGPKSRAQVGLREPATKASVAGCYPFLPSLCGVLSNTFSNCSSIPRRKGAKTMTG